MQQRDLCMAPPLDASQHVEMQGAAEERHCGNVPQKREGGKKKKKEKTKTAQGPMAS